MSCTLIRATASYHKISAGSTPEGGHWPFPLSVSGANIFESMLQSAWWSSLLRLWGARFRGLAFATKDADAFRPPSVFTWKLVSRHPDVSEVIQMVTSIYTYPQLKVAHSIDNTECFTSCNTSINPASIELHEESLGYRTKSVQLQRIPCKYLNQILVFNIAWRSLKLSSILRNLYSNACSNNE